MPEQHTVPLELYSEAINEIWRLRKALAYEALGLQVHTEYKTFPKSRRKIAEEQVTRMQAAARGEVERAYAGLKSYSQRQAMAEAGARETLTNGQWEAERAKRY